MTTKSRASARAPVRAPEIAMLPLGYIVADEESFNARRVYDPKRIQALADSISAIGLETPLEVSRRADGTYDRIAGFRRRRALMQIHGDKASMVQIPCRIVPAMTLEERMLKNLVSDEGHEPVRRVDQARRLHYLCIERKVPVAEAARVVTMRPELIRELIQCWENLIPSIRQAWEKSQSRDHEIPFHLLREWSKYPPEDQRSAFEQYLDPEAAYRADTGEDFDDEEEPKKQKKVKAKDKAKVVLKKLRSRYAVAAMYEELRKDASTKEQRGAVKALAWVLGDSNALRLS